MKSSLPHKKKPAINKTKKTVPLPDSPTVLSSNLFPVVGIGASAGGLDAFKKLLKAIPENSGMAYVLVQHLDPKHESLLPELLQKVTNIPVLEIRDDIKVEPNHIYILPSNKIMVANDGVLQLSPRPEKSRMERNLPIDLFFTSLAEVHQSHAIGVVLSGTASDGTLGLKAIKEQGGVTFAQDEASAAYEGMPHSAAQAGVVDFILPPDKIPEKLQDLMGKVMLSDDELQNVPQQDEELLKQMLHLLRLRKGTDFTYYKQTTIRRRILRRMAIIKKDNLKFYGKYLRENKPEQDLLYQDLLIPVTDFFRDTAIFDNLCKTVFPQVIKNKSGNEPIRIWVAGCSTGQEVYSMAICFKELLDGSSFPFGETQAGRVQIFATDISEPAIAKARAGIYSNSDVAGLSPQHLQEYFTKFNSGYQANKSIRDICVFAVHNFLKDPPFSKIDFISCRNVLIYMEPYLQKKALTTFHYALGQKGILLLGKSETTSGVPELFAALDKKDKSFSRKDAPSRFIFNNSLPGEKSFTEINVKAQKEIIRTDFQKTADDILLSKYSPAGVVINDAMDIVHFRGNTGNYLQPSPGKASLNLLKMAKDGLAFDLRNILLQAKKKNETIFKNNIPVEIAGSLQNIGIEAIPLPNLAEPHYLILFHNNNKVGSGEWGVGSGESEVESKELGVESRKNKSKILVNSAPDHKDLRIKHLEQELAQARNDMRSITEDQEAANEELLSANEELLSGSEELQSLNEEMETSKEELQSTNEELTVLNQEMLGLNEQVTAARDYAESIIATIHEPLLVLDKNLRIKTANESFYTTFQVTEKDTEQHLIYHLGNKQWDIPALRELLENILPNKTTFKNFEVTHNFPGIGQRIMVLNAREMNRDREDEKLILLAIDDITEEANAQKKIEEAFKYYHSMLMHSPFAFSIMKGKEMEITLANDLIKQIWGKGENVEGKTLLQVLPELKDQPFPAMIDSVYTSGKPVTANEILARLNNNGKLIDKYFNVIYYPHLEADKTISGVATIAHEVTDQVLARKKIEESEHRYHEMIYTSPSLISILKGKDMIIEIANDAILESWGKGKNIIGQSIFLVLPETVEQGFDKLLLSVYKTGEPVHAYESPATLLRNGIKELIYYNFIYQAQRNVKGEIEGVAIIATEVTPQALLNKKIKESEAFNRAVLDSSPDCIKMLDAEGRLQFMNSNGICLLELDDFKSVQNTYWWDMWEPANKQIIKDAVATANNGEKIQLQLFSPTAKGTHKWWDIIVLPVQADGTDKNLNRILSVSRDITEQKQNELKEKELLTRFQTLVLQAPVAICVLRGKDYVIETINAGMVEMWDRKMEDVINRPAFDVLPEFRDQGLKELLDNVYNTGESIVLQELPLTIMRHGRMENIFVKFVYEPLREADGTVSGVMALAHEITGQVLSRKKIEESEIKFRTLIVDAPVATCFFTGREMKIEIANDIMLGYWGKGKNVIGKTLVDAVPELKGQPFLQILNEVFTTGKIYEKKNEPAQLEVNGVLGTYYFDYTYKPICNAAGEVYGIMDMAVDVTEQVLARKKIEESENRFRLMAELMPQKIWTSDVEGNKNYFNQKWLEYSGFTLRELEGWGWEKLVHPDDWEQTKKLWQHSIITGQDYKMENRLLRKDGKYLWHLTRAIALKDDAGKIKMWVGSKTEIQEQQELKEELEKAVTKRTNQLQEVNKVLEKTNEELLITREKLITEYSRSLIEASLDPLITLSTEGKITDINQATVNIMESTREDLTGTDFSVYFTEPQKAYEIYREVFVKGIVTNYPLTVKNKNLTEVLFNASVYKDEMGKVLGAVVVARDITLQKRNENELIEARVFAEEEKSKAEIAAKSKQQFLSNMSHEIRTPMNAIIGFTRLVLKTGLTEKQKEYLSAIKISGDTLIVLINDILDLAKVDAGKMTFEQIPFNLAANISAMLHLFETKTADLNIALVKEYDSNIPELLLGDPVRLHQVMLNLLSNAVKFTSQGNITVAVQLIKEEENNVTIKFTVKDTGIGIDENKLESIFENFQQASTGTARMYGGTGLGLAIVKQLVEAQGGSIEVKSKLGQGAAFSFTLIFLKTEDNAALETGVMETDTAVANIKVLLVEDMALNQLLMKTVLEDGGFECDIAVNGKIAIEKLSAMNPLGETSVYDIILMDMHMPEMNGFEATQFIRHTLKSDIPIIALTADVTTVDLEKCKAAGMNDYLAKPVDEKLLFSKIKSLVKKPLSIKPIATNGIEKKQQKKNSIINLDYLRERTKANETLMIKMIELYLEQIPQLITTMKLSWKDMDWQMFYGAVHKLLPSFSIVGIPKEFENQANQLQEYARSQSNAGEIPAMILSLENVCTQACTELITELNLLKNNEHEKR